MRLLLVVMLVAAGCYTDEYEDPAPQVNVHVGGAIIDELDVLVTLDFETNVWQQRGRTVGPLTPLLVARGAEPPMATLLSVNTGSALHVDAPAQEGTYLTRRSIVYKPTWFLAIGRRDHVAVVAALVETLEDDADVTLAAVDLEEWGPRSCKRYYDGEQTTYFIGNGDFDCDGIVTDEDCNPDDFRPCP